LRLAPRDKMGTHKFKKGSVKKKKLAHVPGNVHHKGGKRGKRGVGGLQGSETGGTISGVERGFFKRGHRKGQNVYSCLGWQEGR